MQFNNYVQVPILSSVIYGMCVCVCVQNKDRGKQRNVDTTQAAQTESDRT